jgi:hypothetical protein
VKVIVKKNLIIFRRPHEWEQINQLIIKEYGPKIAISWIKRKELGFTVRRHKGLVKWHDDEDYQQDEEWLPDEFKNRWHYEEQIHLDFYNEAALSFFVLKYLG